MAQMFEFKKVTVGPRVLVATVELSASAPQRTSENLEAVARILDLMPDLASHVCLGDTSPTFGEVIEDTELAHLLEHVGVELLAQTDIAGDVARGQTREIGQRLYEITLGCPDDVLVAGALSSAAWILQWAFSGGGEPRPSIEATVDGLVALVDGLATEVEPQVEADAPESEEDLGEAVSSEETSEPTEEPGEDPTTDPAPEDDPEQDPQDDLLAQPSGWDMDDVPRPHLVR